MNRPVCIIDDDEDIRGVMSFALEYEGINTITFHDAKSAEEGLTKLNSSEYPCVILVDYMMPGINGIEFIKKMRDKYPDTIAKIPMGLSSAGFHEETSILPNGAFRLEKPVDLQNFVGLARDYI